MEKTSRNLTLDLLKFVSAFFVICIHARFPDPKGLAVAALARFAVPVFFMVTGYYYTATCQKGKQGAQIGKIFRLYLFTNLFYFVYRILQNAENGMLKTFFKGLASLTVWRDFLFFGESPFCYLLWYFAALLGVLVIVFFFEKRFDRKYLYPLIPVLVLCNLAFGSYSALLFGRVFSFVYIRNFLFVGLPFFLLGDILGRYRFTLRDAVLIPAALGGLALTLAEYLPMAHFDRVGSAELFVGSVIAAPALVMLAVKHPHAANRPVLRQLAFCGGVLSLYIYFLHPVVIESIIALVSRFGGEIGWRIYAKFQPVWILIFTTVLGYLIHRIQKLMRK